MIVPPPLPPEQASSSIGLLDLHERLAEGWTLTGGQGGGLDRRTPTRRIGERASRRPGVTGCSTLPTAGRTQARQGSETVRVLVAGREGTVRRPNLVARRAMVVAVWQDRALPIEIPNAQISLDRLITAGEL